MKIYTKTGDKGKTSLIGGQRVAKNNIRIEAYGTIDELMSTIGFVRDNNSNAEININLLEILDRLMSCAAILATEVENINIPEILQSDIVFLENEIDKMDSELKPLTSFILTTGHPLVSSCHIARCVCRRAERIIIQATENLYVPDNVVIYINRLSDYLFILARKITKDLKIEEIPWHPRLQIQK
jgi:cob(I)alamin adenosyltransferase